MFILYFAKVFTSSREILHGGRKSFAFYNVDSKIWKAFPQKILGTKTGKIWPDFERLQNSAANVYVTCSDIQNRTST